MHDLGLLQILIILFALVFIFWAFNRHMRNRRMMDDRERRDQKQADQELQELVKGNKKGEE